MNLFQEYEKQQQWRNWAEYLKFIPYGSDFLSLDYGSLGKIDGI